MTAGMSVGRVSSEAEVRMVGAIAAVVPYVVGFEPVRSVVVQVMYEGGRVGASVRVDADAECEVAMYAVDAVARECEGGTAYVIAFEDEPGEADAVSGWAVAAVVAVGLSVQVGTVRGGRVCVPGGWSWPVEVFAHVAAPFVGRGIAPMPSREAVVASVRCGASPEGLAESLGGSPASVEACARAWARVLDPQDEPVEDLPVEVLSDALTGLMSTPTRDALVAVLWSPPGLVEVVDSDAVEGVCAHVGAVEDWQGVHGRMAAMARLVPQGEHRAQALGFLGSGLYFHGDGVRAQVVCDEAAAMGNRLGSLVGMLLRAGVKPKR